MVLTFRGLFRGLVVVGFCGSVGKVKPGMRSSQGGLSVTCSFTSPAVDPQGKYNEKIAKNAHKLLPSLLTKIEYKLLQLTSTQVPKYLDLLDSPLE